MTRTGQGRKDRITRRTDSTVIRTREALRLLPVPSSVGEARRFVGALIGRLARAEVVDIATLLTSELVTNAVVHAGGDTWVFVTAEDHLIRVTVQDPSETCPRRREAAEGAVGGRGLCLVAELADRWGVDLRDAGKGVWFELDI